MNRQIRAITLHQPWATLMAIGVKFIETRSWPAPKALIGQHIAIHAGKRKPDVDRVGDFETCWLSHTGEFWIRDQWGDDRRLPLGEIVCTGRLVDCLPMVAGDGESTPADPSVVLTPTGRVVIVDPSVRAWHWRNISDQKPYGLFTPGRYAWIFDDVARTIDRCPVCMRSPMSDGMVRVDATHIVPRRYVVKSERCATCDTTGSVACVPARGMQGIWTWTP